MIGEDSGDRSRATGAWVRILSTEALKLKRHPIVPGSFGVLGVAPLACGLFMWIAQEPGRAAEMGLLGTKANLMGLTASWAGYFQMITQAVGLIGTLVLAFLTTEVFAGEYVNATARNMLALPVPRSRFVIGKLGVLAVWWTALVLGLVLESLGVAWALGLAGFSGEVVRSGVIDVLQVAGLTYVLVPVIAFLASHGRGPMRPLAFAVSMLIVGNVLGATGWGKWFPWSIVPLFAGVAGPRVEVLAPGSVAVVIATGALGLVATLVEFRWGEIGS